MQKEMKHFKFRPPYNLPVKGNAGTFWKYAIKSTLYYLRQKKQVASGAQKQKKQAQMIQLSECYKNEQYNLWLAENYSKKPEYQLLSIQTGADTVKFKDNEELKNFIFTLECKLSAN